MCVGKYSWSVFLHICVHDMCTCMWKPEIEEQHLPHLLLAVFVEARLSAEAGSS